MRSAARVAILSFLTVMGVAGVAAAAGLDGAQRQQVVDQLSTGLRERYVYPDVGAKAAEAVSANLKNGAYDKIDDPARFAARLTDDIYAVAHDKHMQVIGGGVAPGPPGPPPLPAPRNEIGVVRADKLAGGVGYIEIVAFPSLPQFKPVIDRAMTALAGSKALIIDDRRNGGGDPVSEAYLDSFLTHPGVHIIDVVSRLAKTDTFTRQVYESSRTPVSFAGVPVVVLISARTFSAGEAFAYDVQGLKLGTTVGEATGGGANLIGPVPLGQGMEGSIPWGRPESPVTHTNWEGKGVQPDVTVQASDALKVALARLGQPAVADISAASRSQVFAPRTTAQPGSEAALRKAIGGFATNAPDYATMSPMIATLIRQQLPGLNQIFTKLGSIQAVNFAEVDNNGSDAYDLTFSGGALRITVMLDGGGKIAGLALIFPRNAGA